MGLVPAHQDEAEGRANRHRDDLGLGNDAVPDAVELLTEFGLDAVLRPSGPSASAARARSGDTQLITDD